MSGLPPFIPTGKGDDAAVSILKQTDWHIVRPHAMLLLEWIQDINWPIAGDIATLLSAHTNSLKPEILLILEGNDSMWKYWCIWQLIYNSEETYIDNDILVALEKLAANPSKADLEDEVVEVALGCLEKWRD